MSIDNGKFVISKTEMDFWEKIFWRLKFLLFESWGKNFSVILHSLKPAKKRGASELSSFLAKIKKIELDRNSNYFKYKNFTFYFEQDNEINSAMPDFVSIWASRDKFFDNNFINNSAYIFEGPYNGGGVFIEKGDVVIDVGANIGLFSVLASIEVGDSGRVYSFEPIEKTNSILEKNIKINNLNNVKIEKKALGDKEGKISFSKMDTLGASSGYIDNNGEKEIVNQVTLDTYVLANDIDKIDFIKADIEGMERNLLMGGEKTIKKFKPKMAICIYHRDDDPEVIETLLRDYVPEYNIYKTETKIYAWI